MRGRRHHQLPLRHMTIIGARSPRRRRRRSSFRRSTKRASIGAVVTALRRPRSWHEILVVDDGSTDDTAARAAAAGAACIRHPYNKGNGAAVKTGIRQASGKFVLIVDARRPASAERRGAARQRSCDEYDLVVGARSGRSQASVTRRAGQRAAQRARELSDRAADSRSDVGLPCGAARVPVEFLHLIPNGFSTPTTTTLAFLKAGYSVRFEPVDAARREGASKIRLGPDGVGFFLILLKVITIFSPLRIFLPISAAAFALGAGYARLDDRDAVARDQLVGAADPVERGDLSRRPGLGADLFAALRGAPLVTAPSRAGHRARPTTNATTCRCSPSR